MQVDYSKLHDGLNRLSGRELLLAEQAERNTGNKMAELSLSKSFQARLAALALEVPVDDLKELPLREFNLVTSTVFTFLYPAEASGT